ncbi:hypothetical protein OUZ56_016727 [Daphnia magna]|uniref:Uncharacterized protein n=1 Tax=Daphnia magna TaxID=35525 RepID=A0ABR0ARG6_9CRUS|nr:hypothetical protein OUZ56_016727 [Daphnia magna]
MKEFKRLLREKDKQLRSVMRHQAKSTRYIDRLKIRLKVTNKKLNTSKQQITRMKRYAQEVAVTIDNLKEEISNLTANQLEEKIKHLSHGERVIINTFIQKGRVELQSKSGWQPSMTVVEGIY